MDDTILNELIRLEREGGEALLATIIEARGSTPRGVGTRMLILPRGRIFGTIGGGSMERRVVEKVLELLKEEIRPKPTSLTLDLGSEALEEEMVCGGTLVLFLQPLSFKGFGDR